MPRAERACPRGHGHGHSGEPLRDFVEHLAGTENAKEEDGTRALKNFYLCRAIN